MTTLLKTQDGVNNAIMEIDEENEPMLNLLDSLVADVVSETCFDIHRKLYTGNMTLEELYNFRPKLPDQLHQSQPKFEQPSTAGSNSWKCFSTFCSQHWQC